MRAAAALAVLLCASASACSSDDGSTTTVLPRDPGGAIDQKFGAPDDLEPDVEVVDLDRIDSRGVRAFERPTPCSLPSLAISFWADENLACGRCFVLVCDGDAYAHVCTHQCDVTDEPDGDRTVPFI